jgi:stringent starvation protein B
MSDGPLPLKRDVAKMLLRKGSLFVHLDPRASDVFVPPWLRHQAQLVLQVGFDMPIPIRDLRVDDDGVFGTLSFSRNPFTCAVPWHAVFALVGDEGRGMVWPESMPAEIAAEVEREAMRSKVSSETTRGSESRQLRDTSRDTPSGRGELGIVRGGGSSYSDLTGPHGTPGTKEREAASLRAAEPGGRRRDSNRPGPNKPGGRRRALPPYLRVVK